MKAVTASISNGIPKYKKHKNTTTQLQSRKYTKFLQSQFKWDMTSVAADWFGKLKAIKPSRADSYVSLRRLIEFCCRENFTTYKTEGIVDRMVDTNNDNTGKSDDVLWK
jgi:hypothetical protein